MAQVVSLVGLAMIVASILTFDKTTPFPGVYALLPTLGAAFILLGARAGTVVHWLLSLRPVVFIGLISYSAYLWHQPLFAFARIHARDEVPPWVFGLLSGVTLVLAWLTWLYVERPFRVRGSAVPRISTRALVVSTSGASALFLAAGMALHLNAGFPARFYPAAEASSPDFQIAYNERNYAYRKPGFENDGRIRLLVLGDSFARDAINMMVETLDLSGVDLVYRQEFFTCLATAPHPGLPDLARQADIVLITSGRAVPECAAADIAWLEGAQVFYFGPKSFGANLNWLVRVPPTDRREAQNAILQDMLELEEEWRLLVPPGAYVSLLDPIRVGDRITIADERGYPLSGDRVHLTRNGAIYLGLRVLPGSAFAAALGAPLRMDVARQ